MRQGWWRIVAFARWCGLIGLAVLVLFAGCAALLGAIWLAVRALAAFTIAR